MALELSDYTANGNDFTINNGCTEETDAPAGLSGATKCVDISAGDNLQAPDSASLSITGDFTIEFWYKTSQTNGSWWIYKWDTNQQSYSMYGTSDERVQVVVDIDGTGGNQNGASAASTVPVNGAWHHCAIVYDSVAHTVVTYIDEVSVGAFTYTGTMGAIFDGTASFFLSNIGTGGSIRYSDLRVWNDKRTSTEINDNNGVRLTGSEANLVAYWPFEALVPPTLVKSVDGLAQASVKSVNGLAIASVKSINGLA